VFNAIAGLEIEAEEFFAVFVGEFATGGEINRP